MINSSYGAISLIGGITGIIISLYIIKTGHSRPLIPGLDYITQMFLSMLLLAICVSVTLIGVNIILAAPRIPVGTIVIYKGQNTTVMGSEMSSGELVYEIRLSDDRVTKAFTAELTSIKQ